jgi:hypothetical protein
MSRELEETKLLFSLADMPASAPLLESVARIPGSIGKLAVLNFLKTCNLRESAPAPARRVWTNDLLSVPVK